MKKTCVTLLLGLAFALPIYAQEGRTVSHGNLNTTVGNKSLLEIVTPDNLQCNINLETHHQNNITAEYQVWAHAKNAEQEDRFLKLIAVKLDNRGGSDEAIKIRVLAPTTAPWEGTSYGVGADLEIWVPENFEIDTKMMRGDIVIEGPLKYAEVDCEYGSVEISYIDGETSIKTSYADIEASYLEGAVSIESIYSNITAEYITITSGIGTFSSSNGKLDLENITGPIEATTSNENIIAENLIAEFGSIILRTNYGRIDGDLIKGELIAETSYQPINLDDIYLLSGSSRIETFYSPINVEVSQIDDTELTVNNTYNSINLLLPDDMSGKLILNIDEGGKIHTKGLSIKPLVMDKNRLVGLVGDGAAKIESNVSGIGDIYIEGY